MPRVKRGTTHVRRRKNLLSRTKGYKWGRKNKIKEAKTAVLKAGAHAYRDRRTKKRTNRSLWLVRINAAVREEGLTYSKFIDMLKKSNVEVDRKILSDIAQKNPQVFKAIVEQVKK